MPAPNDPHTPTVRGANPITLSGKSLPPLTTPGPRRPADPPPPPPRDEVLLTPAPVEAAAPAIRLKPIYAVVPTSRLLGETDDRVDVRPEVLVEAVVAAAAGGVAPRTPGEVTLLPNGTWTCLFPSSLSPTVVPR